RPGSLSSTNKLSAWSRFVQWTDKEEERHHLGWVGGALAAEACFIFPGTMLAILANGASFGLIIVAMITFGMVVVTNLAALSTRYTIPVFFGGILINVAAIVASFFHVLQ